MGCWGSSVEILGSIRDLLTFIFEHRKRGALGFTKAGGLQKIREGKSKVRGGVLKEHEIWGGGELN